MFYEKDPNVKATVHFDTSRGGTEFKLRHIFFAYEDRAQITELFCETFERLTAAVSVLTNATVQATELWEKSDASMTDAVAKNLGIEDRIPVALGSNHHPYHLLCKTHTFEALHRSNLEVLVTIEKKVSNEKSLKASILDLNHSFEEKQVW